MRTITALRELHAMWLATRAVHRLFRTDRVQEELAAAALGTHRD
jgi:hypothetical protein